MKLYKDKNGNLVNLDDLTEIKIPKIGDNFIYKLSGDIYVVKEIASVGFSLVLKGGKDEVWVPFTIYEEVLKPYSDDNYFNPYYPPEDEWPPKPIPKEGYEWVKMPESGISEAGDMSLMSFGEKDELRWEFDEWSISYSNTVYFRLSEIKYEPLAVGDKIQEGDKASILNGLVPYEKCSRHCIFSINEF